MITLGGAKREGAVVIFMRNKLVNLTANLGHVLSFLSVNNVTLTLFVMSGNNLVHVALVTSVGIAILIRFTLLHIRNVF